MMNNWILTKIRAKKPQKKLPKFEWAPFDRNRAFAYCPHCLGINVLSCIEGYFCRNCGSLVTANLVNESDYAQILRENGR